MNYLFNKPIIGSIRSANSPVEGFSLSGTVLVSNQGVAFCYVTFDEAFVKRLGIRMPYGLGEAHPAYLRVINKQTHFDVLCEYVDKSKKVFLWYEDEMPVWVKNVKAGGV